MAIRDLIKEQIVPGVCHVKRNGSLRLEVVSVDTKRAEVRLGCERLNSAQVIDKESAAALAVFFNMLCDQLEEK